MKKTTWEDLSSLGWPINNIYVAANARRGGTMSGVGDLSLNGGAAADWGWWSYNSILGSPYLIQSTPTSTASEQTAWSYDNTANSEPFTDIWSESWENKVSADLFVTSGLTIGLEESITIANVASTSFNMSMSLETKTAQHNESVHSLSHSWSLSVQPGEKLSLVRVITTSTTVTDYGLTYGLRPESMIGTQGQLFEGHYYYGFNLNELCNYPKGTVSLQGIGTSTTYEFKLVREGASGRVLEAHSGPQPSALAGASFPVQLHAAAGAE